MSAPRRRPWPVALLALSLAPALAGCGYSFRPPYRNDIRTVYVPVFKSVSFRKDLNLQLTYLVQQEIERRTPYKVVGSPEGADSTLEGTVTLADKNMMVENPNNLPRQIMGTLVTTVKWTDNRLSFEKKKALAPVPVVETTPFYPEVGETTQLGFTRAMEQTAREIVDMMEEPW